MRTHVLILDYFLAQINDGERKYKIYELANRIFKSSEDKMNLRLKLTSLQWNKFSENVANQNVKD